MIHFAINHWAAWAATRTDRASWQSWLEQPESLAESLAESDLMPPLSEMPAALRRRANRLGRAALQVSYECAGQNGPIVYASRYGEIARSVELLQQLAASEPLSPTNFSHSVHNAVGALFSLAGGSRHYSAIAAGEETIEAAFTEATGLLADGAPQVTVVYYEAPLPKPYQQFESLPVVTHAWGCRLQPVAHGGLTLLPGTPTANANFCAPHNADLQLLRFLLTHDQKQLTHQTGNRCWLWQRHD